MVTFLAESISWCERKQRGERKCKQILMLHFRSGYNLKFWGSPLLTWSSLLPMFPKFLGDRLASSFSSVYFCRSGLVSSCVKIVSPPCLWEEGDVISRSHLAGIAVNRQALTPMCELHLIPAFSYIDSAQCEALCPVICQHFS